ncbi:MAG: hypothetical protein DMG08_29945 [Acidobacteria bacterium]|nr:MAG: hypothetical protein DMG08_29945 [Acidobacteriota bacterium]
MDVPYGQARLGGHSDRCQRRDVCDGPGWRVCAGAGDGRAALEVRRGAHGSARTGVLARVSRPASARVCGEWTFPVGRGCRHRKTRAPIRRPGTGRQYELQSPPAVFEDVVITGCSNGEGSPSAGAYGDIRGWDARTGKLLWTFHTVPRPGEPGSETWPPGAWKNRSGTNVWGFFTIDVKRGIVYAPLGSPTDDFYGADRVGDNLYGNSLVALDARTGEKKWHRQLVHHDIWDYDLAAPPALFDIRRAERVIPAVAQITKMGLLFVLDRVTGEPVYGIEERAVPQTEVPGEVTAKTQPFPLKPPPLGKNEFRLEEMYDVFAASCSRPIK